MSTIYENFLENVLKGQKFKVDFEKRNLKVGNRYLIEDGSYEAGKILLEKNETPVLEIIEQLFQEYKYSMPSEKSEKNRKTYFRAAKPEEMTDEQMAFGIDREFARAKLEGYILCAVCNGTLTWNENWGSWFWQSAKDRDLTILKKWIEPEEKEVVE